MTTLGAALRDVRSRLISTLNLETPVASLEAHVLLGHALNQPRTYLLAHPDTELSSAQTSAFDALLQRRLNGEPIAYILGHREFYGLDFSVTPAVLIPRPETELLVELALAHIPQKRPMRILDLGTGSGAIALTLAKLRPLSQMTAVDLSPDALAVAQHNAERQCVRNIRFIRSDWFQALDENDPFDLIVANPPYIAANDPHLQRGDVRFEPLNALQSGADGLDAIRRIAAESRRFLTPSAWLMFEHGYNQKVACANILATFAYENIRCQHDLAGQPRVSSGRNS